MERQFLMNWKASKDAKKTNNRKERVQEQDTHITHATVSRLSFISWITLPTRNIILNNNKKMPKIREGLFNFLMGFFLTYSYISEKFLTCYMKMVATIKKAMFSS